jgi:hypothetical protein
MITSVLSHPTTIDPVPLERAGIALVKLRGDLWRMTRATGEVLGYVEQFPTSAGERFRAKRLLTRQGRFVVDGEFWSVNDAIECLRR